MAAIQLDLEILAQVASLSAADRAKRLRDVQRDLASARASLRIAHVKVKGHTGRHDAAGRAAGLRKEIERIKRETARRIALLEKQVKEIEEEDQALPVIMSSLKEKIKELEQEEKLLTNGKLLKQLHGMLQA
jgi:hypothetical protein